MIPNRIRKKQLDYTWPGFVDALSSLLMVIIFVLMIFVISQFFISQKMSGQDEALIKLKNNLIVNVNRYTSVINIYIKFFMQRRKSSLGTI